MNRGDTIFALASAAGRAGVAVFRVSGPQAGGSIKHLTGQEIPPSHRAVVRKLRGRLGRHRRGLGAVVPRPASLTGEDVAEFQVHGGRAIAEALATELAPCPAAGRPSRANSPGARSKTANSI